MRERLTRLYSVQGLRFVVVGVLNTAFSYAIYALFLYAGFGYKQANLAALLLGIVFSFRTQGVLVFRNTDKRLFLRFVIAWACIYLLTIATIGLFMRWGVNAYWAGLFALPVSIALSYLTQKYFVFRARP